MSTSGIENNYINFQIPFKFNQMARNEISPLTHLMLPAQDQRRPSVEFDMRLTPSPERSASPGDPASKRQRLVRMSNVSKDSNTSVRHKKCSQLNVFAIRLMVVIVFIAFIIFFYKYYIYLSNQIELQF